VTHRREVTRWTLQECGFLTDCQDLQEVAGSIQAALAAVQPDLTIRQRELVQERYTWKAIALAYRNLFRTFRNQD
jgi:glycosyltransferase involved in cell wall biosynthesis